MSGKLTGILSFTVLFLGIPALAAAQTITANFGDVLTNHPCVQADLRIADEVREKTSGRIDIKVFDNGQLGGSQDMAEAVKVGTQVFLQESPVFFDRWAPPFTVLDVAYVWKDLDHAYSVLSGSLGKELNQMLVDKAGVRVLGYMYYGTRHLTANKPVRKPSDLKGVKLRVPDSEVSISMAKAWGAQAVIVNFNELFQALKQGVAEAQENPLPTISSQRFYSVQKFVMLTGHETNIRGVFVNEAWWQKLSAADRKIIQDAVDKAVIWCRKEIESREKDLIEGLKANGMTIITPDREAFRSLALAAFKKDFATIWGGWYEKVSQAK